MRQIIYESQSTGARASHDAPGILNGARPFNGLNGVTGLLCAADDRFLQLLEGPDESLDVAMSRILKDPRHRDIQVLSDQPITERVFADWSMAYRDEGHPADLLGERLRLMLRHTPAPIADRFRQFVGS